MFCYNTHLFFQYSIILHSCHIFVTRHSHFKRLSIACILYSCLRLFYCVNVKILSSSYYECKHSILFFVNSSIFFRFRVDLIFKFLNHNHILSLQNIFENDLYEELRSSSFNLSFENEIILSNFFLLIEKIKLKRNISKMQKRKERMT